VIRRELIQRGVKRRVGVEGLGRARRARGIVVDERMKLLAVAVRFVRGAGLGGGREAVELRHGIRRQSGRRGDLVGKRRTAQFAFEHSAGASHKRDLCARVT
jgi:hypothetical protein